MHEIAAIILAFVVAGLVALEAQRRADEVDAMSEAEKEEDRDLSQW